MITISSQGPIHNTTEEARAMAIDFTLTAEQKALQATAREFAQDMLKPLVAKAKTRYT